MLLLTIPTWFDSVTAMSSFLLAWCRSLLPEYQVIICYKELLLEECWSFREQELAITVYHYSSVWNYRKRRGLCVCVCVCVCVCECVCVCLCLWMIYVTCSILLHSIKHRWIVNLVIICWQSKSFQPIYQFFMKNAT